MFLDAAKRGDFATVRKLAKANAGYVNVQPLGRWSALHQAASKADVEAVRFLLSKGADQTVMTRKGETPYDVAHPNVKALLTPPDPRSPGAGPHPEPVGSDSSFPMATVAMVREAAPKRPAAEVEDAVQRCGGDADLAIEALLTDPPSLCAEPERWFHHFDLGGDGLLQRREVIVALLHSLGPEENPADVNKVVNGQWPTFDWRGSGALDLPGFLEPGGLRDFILERWGHRLAPEPHAGDATAPASAGEEAACEDDGRQGDAELAAALGALEDEGVLGLYFSAHLLNDSTSLLRGCYESIRSRGLPFGILSVSLDADKAGFEAQGSLPWKSVPFSCLSARQQLAERFKVQAVPQLVLLAKDGALITADGLRVLAGDPQGAAFPWAAAVATVAASSAPGPQAPVSKMRSAVRHLIGRESSSGNLDDVSLARSAARVPLTEEGYQEVASFKSNYAMKRFVQRVISTKQWVVLDKQKLTELIWEHSGVNRVQSLERLLEDLNGAKWIMATEVEAEAADDAPALPNPTATLPMPGLRTVTFRHAFCSRAKPATGLAKTAGAPEASPGPAEHGTVRASVPASVASGPTKAEGSPAGAGEALEPPPPPAGPAEAAEAAAVPPEAAGPVASPPDPPEPPCPVVSPGLPATGEAPPQAPGKGKAPPQAPGKGKAPPPAPGKGKGPPLAPGKGKLPPPAPGQGKGPPPVLGKGKAPCKGAGKGPEPSRQDVLEWQDKKKNPLRWKRLLQAEGIFDDSLFAGAQEVEVNHEALARAFVRNVLEGQKRAKEFSPTKEAVRKPVLWAPTEKKTQEQRRQQVAIQMKAWNADDAQLFLDRLGRLDMNAIRFDPDFREDRFEQLTSLVEEMATSGVEWQRLAEPNAANTYEWDKDVEGFFRRLQTTPNFQERLSALQAGLLVDSELDALGRELSALKVGMESVVESAAFRLVFRKVLSIGNCLNAGQSKFNRADGFDVVALLEATDFLESYKGAGSLSLLRYLQEQELSAEERQGLAELAAQLKGISWKPPAPGGEEDEGLDPTDLGELRRRSNDVSRALGQLGRSLEHSRARLEGGPAPAAEAGAEVEVQAFQLQQLRCFLGLLEEHKRRSIEVESELDAVEEALHDFQRFLAHQPPKKKELVAGHSLGIVAHFVRKLGEGTEQRPNRRGSAASRPRAT